jgi:hypothetical protein
MAVSSLNKFTVPLASDQSASSQGLLMPKLKYRFRVIFENFGVSTPRSELTKQVVNVKRPSVSFEGIDLPVYNSTIKLAGRHNWDDVTVTLRDDMAGSVAKLVGEQLQKQFDFMEQSSASSGIDYKFIMKVEVLDGGNGGNEPTVLETWEMYGCYVSTADYGDMEYSANEPATISLTVRYDNAIQSPVGSGIGATVARTLGTNSTG